MDVKTSEHLTTDVLSALARGKIPEALRDSELLWEAYSPFLHLCPDAALALCFNHLLATLSHSTPHTEESGALALRLLEVFRRIEQPTALVEVVAQRTLTLLAPGDLLQADISHALCEVAMHFTEPCEPFTTLHLRCEELPSAEVLSQLFAADLGLTLYLIVGHVSNPSELKRWLLGIYQEHAQSASAPYELRQALQSVAQGALNGGNVYSHLLSAFEWAVGAAPALAFEWLAGLLLWERDPATRAHLQSQLRRPLEQRIELTIRLYVRQAALLIDEEGAERLGLRFLSEAATLGEALIEVIYARLAQRRTLADLEQHARIALLLSHIYRSLGDHALAFQLLSRLLPEARRATFSHPPLPLRVMRATAGLLERLGRSQQAQELYFDACRMSGLQFLCNDQLSDPMDTLLAYRQGGLNVEVAFEAIYAITDYYRLWFLEHLHGAEGGVNPEPWQRAMRWLSGQLEGARALLPYTPYLEVQLYIELTACVMWAADAPARALGYARALNKTSAAALSDLHALRIAALRPPAPSQGERPAERAPSALALARLEEHRRVLTEAKRGGHGDILRYAAIFYLCECAQVAQAISPSDSGAHKRLSELERHVSEWAMFASRGPLNHLSGPFDVLLPACDLSMLEGALQVFVERDMARAAYAFAHALRHITQRTFVHPRRAQHADEIKELHAERFYINWIHQRALDEGHYQRYDIMFNQEEPAPAPIGQILTHEVLLEYKSFDGWLCGVAIRGDAPVVARRLSITERELIELTGALNEALCTPPHEAYAQGADERVAELSVRLYQLIILPFEEVMSGAHRLLLASDGPLDHLPFCALQSASGVYLVQRFELIRLWVSGDSSLRPRAQRERESGAGARGVLCVSQTARGDHLSRALERHDPSERPTTPPTLTRVTPEELTSPEARARYSSRPNQWLCLSARAYEGQLYLSDRVALRSPRTLNQALCDLDLDGLALLEPTPLAEVGGVLCGALSAAREGVLVCHWESSLCEQWIAEIIATASPRQRALGYVCALTELRRKAIRARLPAREWAALEFYTHDFTTLVGGEG